MFIDKIQILGPQNSGTNLLKNLLTNNLTNIILVEDLKFIWKHEIDINILDNIIHENQSRLFICMYRPVIHWVHGIKKDSYEIIWNRKIKDPCGFRNKQYSNIVELYNRFYSNYIKLIKKYDNVIFLNYHNLIEEENIFIYLSSKLNKFGLYIISKPLLYERLNKPSKNHGFSVKNSSEAIQKRNQIDKLINEGNQDEHNEINLLLDKQIVSFFE